MTSSFAIVRHSYERELRHSNTRVESLAYKSLCHTLQVRVECNKMQKTHHITSRNHTKLELQISCGKTAHTHIMFFLLTQMSKENFHSKALLSATLSDIAQFILRGETKILKICMNSFTVKKMVIFYSAGKCKLGLLWKL